MGPLKSATAWTFISFIICSGKIEITSTQKLTTDDYLITLNTHENNSPTSDTSATTLLTYGATISTSTTSLDDGATGVALSTSGVDGANMTTPTSISEKSGATISTSTTSLDDGANMTTPISTGEESGATISTSTTSLDDGATGVALSTSGVDGTNMTTPHSNGEESGATISTSTTSLDDGANMTTHHSNGEESGATISTSTTSLDDGATGVALSTSGVDGVNMTTPHSNGEESGVTISTSTTSLDDGGTGVALSTSGVDGANMTTPISTGKESGTNSTTPNKMRSGSADYVYWIGEMRTSDVIISSDINSSTDSPVFDIDDPEWIWSRLTWKWDIILQLASAIIGILGNSLVIVVIFSRRASGRSTDRLIGNLAIADFVTSFAIIPYPTPISVPNTWQGMFWCVFMFQNLPLWLPVTASSYILMAISIERYIAVVYPLRFSQIVTVRRVSIVVGFIWLIALLSLLFGFFITGIDQTYGFCTLTVTTQHGLAAVGSYWFCIRIVVPVAIMVITQSLIAVELHRQSKTFRGNSSSTNSFHIVARNRVLKVMLEIIIVYVVCWLPNQVAFLGTMVGLIEWGVYIGSPLHRVLTVIGFYNSCLNPFIYAAQHPQFRVAIKELCRGKTNKNTFVFSEHKPDSSDKKRYTSKDMSSV